MTEREVLLTMAEKYLGKNITESQLKKEYPQFFYKPDVVNAGEEIDMNRIEGLLWDYKVSFKKIEVGDGTCREKAASLKICKRKDLKDKFFLFMKLANLSDEGKAVVSKEKFESGGLPLGNGGSWCRDSSKLAQIFKLDRKKEDGNGNTIVSIELIGWNREIPFDQRIKKDIWDRIHQQNCVITGADASSSSENTKIEVDHKDGRKNDCDYNDIENQKEEWFQPLCKAANDFKRQKCKVCKEKGKRWSAANIKGYEKFPFYEGNEKYVVPDDPEKCGCVGCYLYDPVEFRKRFVEHIKKSVKQ